MKVKKNNPKKLSMILLVFTLSLTTVGCSKDPGSQIKENNSEGTKVENSVSPQEESVNNTDKQKDQMKDDVRKEEKVRDDNKNYRENYKKDKSSNHKKPVANDSKNNQSSIKKPNTVTVSGTIRMLSYEEVLKLQGIKDPNPGGLREPNKYAILVLNRPQTMYLYSTGSEYANKAYGKVSMISFLNVSKLEDYNGKTVKMVINKDRGFYWPGDTMLPLYQPVAQNYRIISVSGKGISSVAKPVNRDKPVNKPVSKDKNVKPTNKPVNKDKQVKPSDKNKEIKIL